LIWETHGLTVALSVISLLVGWFVAIRLGVVFCHASVSVLDYILTIISLPAWERLGL
jgi:ABC-type dipeptide/oligopeptide/nickel transport system permease component